MIWKNPNEVKKISEPLEVQNYLVEPGIVKNVDTALVNDRGTMSFGGGERSRTRSRRTSLQTLDQRRSQPHLPIEVRHCCEAGGRERERERVENPRTRSSRSKW